MKYILVAVAITLILFTLTKKDHDIQTLHPRNSILAFGDSLTYGYNAKPAESYPAVLSTTTGLRVINAGIPAETSKEVLQRLPKHLEDPSIKLMVLCVGGNDMMQQIPLTTLKNNIKTMIHMAKEKEIDVLLISVPNITLFGLSPLPLYEEIAEEENIPLISGLLAEILSDPSLKSDQIHPNALGYKQMAEKIVESLKENGWINK
ncbi:GDSL-type esterase/lipase family protein [Sulfurovum sp.]|uniref:GDSL-type esterase/lipase family protein n=1 Tax=Sulfurovum sp. TaxID=1969726 RepID=UPI002867DFF4|nr:GDSL-type esterase/lipase family protein [Sulfurovum sp.]